MAGSRTLPIVERAPWSRLRSAAVKAGSLTSHLMEASLISDGQSQQVTEEALVAVESVLFDLPR